MNNKRKPLSFPELESRGRHAILRSAEEVQAEEALLESQDAGMPGQQHAGLPEIQTNGSRTHYPKATYRLSPEALDAIDDAKRVLRRQHNIKASLEEIAEEAILAAYRDLLENQLASMLANRFASKPATKTYG